MKTKHTGEIDFEHLNDQIYISYESQYHTVQDKIISQIPASSFGYHFYQFS